MMNERTTNNNNNIHNNNILNNNILNNNILNNNNTSNNNKNITATTTGQQPSEFLLLSPLFPTTFAS